MAQTDQFAGPHGPTAAPPSSAPLSAAATPQPSWGPQGAPLSTAQSSAPHAAAYQGANYQHAMPYQGPTQGPAQGAYQGTAQVPYQRTAPQGAMQGSTRPSTAAGGGGTRGPQDPSGSAVADAGKSRLDRWSSNLGLHILMVACLSVLLLIPTMFFNFVLEDRRYNEELAIESMVSPWGGQQQLADPELIVPVEAVVSYSYEENDWDNVQRRVNQIKLADYYVSPLDSESTVSLESHKRYRGNYETTLYRMVVQQVSTFALSERLSEIESRAEVQQVMRNRLKLIFHVSNNKGIDEIKYLCINGKAYTPEPSSNYSGIVINLDYLDVGKIISGERLVDADDSRSCALLKRAAAAEASASDVASGAASGAAKGAASGAASGAAAGATGSIFAQSAFADKATDPSLANADQLRQVPDLVNHLAADADQEHTAVAVAAQEAPALEPGIMTVEALYYVRGAQGLSYLPIAQDSRLTVTGTGVVPSFGGAFLPTDRAISGAGFLDSAQIEDLSFGEQHVAESTLPEGTEPTFKAYYAQNNLATGQAQVRTDKEPFNYHCSEIEYQIALADTSESYQLIDRLTKYVLLFIAMTFVTILAFEIVMRRMVSLVQYVVVGAALILFYMVLLALSEHTSFVLAYVTGALLMSLMIAAYLKAVLNSLRSAICVAVLLLAMYAVLFAIVHVQAYALLVGTVLLVIMLGIVMFITRRLNAPEVAPSRGAKAQSKDEPAA